jgi:thiol-disulfide isomerase/thioredoxin
MVQGNFCGYCTSFKPHFQKVAEELRTIDFGTIQIDGDDTEFYRKNIDSIINTPLQGVPTVIKLYKGRPIDMYNGNLQYADFKRWVLNN